MFSKALFKQSCRANGTMWGIITCAVCFMLACVMLISGNGSIGEVKNSIQDTIITKEVDAQLQKRALRYYLNAEDGLARLDANVAANASDTLSYLVWCSQMPDRATYPDDSVYTGALAAWQAAVPTMQTEAGRTYADAVSMWQAARPTQDTFPTAEAYASAVASWQADSPLTEERAVTAAYTAAISELRANLLAEAAEAGLTAEDDETQELLGSVLYVVNPGGAFNDFYIDHGEPVPTDYALAPLLAHISSGDTAAYVASDERVDYRRERAAYGTSVFLAGNTSSAESIDALTEALASYGVTREKYESFGYTYAAVKHMAHTAIVTYAGRLDYELTLLTESDYPDRAAYLEAVANKKESLAADVSSSFLSTLPDAVSDALEEIGQADLYTLIVGSIFYKLAGLLLPIIYVIMASNNLIAGQVDSGSMAYVLSTSTKRSTVVLTQALYLVGSLLAMFALTTVTGCICLAFVAEEVELTYGELILLNVGAFLVLLALSGLCFFTSCIFDRSKRSMAIGGGLSIFALVAAMLGLFGSPVIPSVVRLEALNYFNYTTIISLFDVISIMEGSTTYLWKYGILLLIGIVGYTAGSFRFVKKDLPL